MKHNQIKSLTKKHSLFWFYEKQTKYIRGIGLGLLSSYILVKLISLLMELFTAYSDISKRITLGLLCVIVALSTIAILRVTIGKAYFVYKRLSNIRYLPISHDECMILGIHDATAYLDVVNDMLNVNEYYTSAICPSKFVEELYVFVQMEFGRNVCFNTRFYLSKEECDA